MAKFILIRGGQLPNGATILDFKDEHTNEAVVLCKWREQYVTCEIDSEGNAKHEYYTKDYQGAFREFIDR